MSNGIISENSLMEKLNISKKIMNKMDESTGDGSYDYDNYDYSEYDSYTNVQETTTPTKTPTTNIERIKNSGLPDVIKQAMIENPIEQPTMVNNGPMLNESIINNARKLMGGESKPQPQKPMKRSNNGNITISPENLIKLISETVEKVLDKKLKEFSEVKDSVSNLNENLVLKVGDNIFKGKITGMKKK